MYINYTNISKNLQSSVAIRQEGISVGLIDGNKDGIVVGWKVGYEEGCDEGTVDG